MTTNVTTVSFAKGTAPVGDTAVFEIYIKATPERIWEAITDPEQRAKYSFGVQTQSDWATGSTYRAGVPGVVDIAQGENLVVEPPRLLVQSFNALWSDEVKAQGTTGSPGRSSQWGTPAGSRSCTTSSRTARTPSCTAAGR